MGSKTRRPAWWLLFVLLIGMLGLVLLESRDGASNPAHELIDGIIVVGFFFALLAWVNLNMSALQQRELEHASLSEFHVVEYEPKQSGFATQQFTDARSLVEVGDPRWLAGTKN